MKAAVIRDVGALAELDDVAEPVGETIEVLAAPINPIDLAVSRGVLATGHPELPYVPGCDAVGRTAGGGIVWIFGGSLGRASNGSSVLRILVLMQRSDLTSTVISSGPSRRRSRATGRATSSTLCGASLQQPLLWLPRRRRRSSTLANRRARRPLFLPRRCVSRAS